MSTVARTTASTVVTLLGTVGAAADTAAKVIGTVTSSVDMLDRYVQRAQANQIARHKIEDKFYLRNLIIENAAAQEEIEHELTRKYSDPTRSAKLQLIITDLESLFTENQP